MKKEIKILLVEDNEGDIVLTLEALSMAKVSNGVDVVRDGEAAIQYLRQENSYASVSLPDLILLDINLPKMDGLEVLKEIKEDNRLAPLPVVMLTTSESEGDIVNSYRYHASCFIVKPVDFDKFMKVVLAIKEFWINIVRLPHINNA